MKYIFVLLLNFNSALAEILIFEHDSSRSGGYKLLESHGKFIDLLENDLRIFFPNHSIDKLYESSQETRSLSIHSEKMFDKIIEGCFEENRRNQAQLFLSAGLMRTPYIGYDEKRLKRTTDDFQNEYTKLFQSYLNFNKIRFVNMSIGIQPKDWPQIKSVIEENPNILFITAAGNFREDLMNPGAIACKFNPIKLQVDRQNNNQPKLKNLIIVGVANNWGPHECGGAFSEPLVDVYFDNLSTTYISSGFQNASSPATVMITTAMELYYKLKVLRGENVENTRALFDELVSGASGLSGIKLSQEISAVDSANYNQEKTQTIKGVVFNCSLLNAILDLLISFSPPVPILRDSGNKTPHS